MTRMPKSTELHRPTPWIIMGMFLLGGLFLYSISGILLPFVAGCIGAYALNPCASTLEKWGLGRAFSTAITMLCFITVISVFLMIIIPYMHYELISIYHNLPEVGEKIVNLTTPLVERLSLDFGLPTVEDIKTKISAHIGDIAKIIVAFLINILGSGMVLANIISLLILTPIVMFYFLKDWHSFLRAIEKLIPHTYRPRVFYFLSRIHTILGEYAKGQSIVCLSLILIYIPLLYAIQLPDAFFIGFLTGFLAFIPYLGAFIGLMLSFIVALIQFQGWWQIFAVIGIFSAVNLFEGNFLTPRFIGKRVGLHPVWIIFSLMAAATLFGFMGVIITLPVAAILSTIVRILLEEYYKSPFYTKNTPEISTQS